MGGEGDQEGLEKNTMFCRKIETQCSGGFARHKVQFDWTLALSALQLLLARGTNYSLVLIGYKFKPLSITAAFSKKKNNLFFFKFILCLFNNMENLAKLVLGSSKLRINAVVINFAQFLPLAPIVRLRNPENQEIWKSDR